MDVSVPVPLKVTVPCWSVNVPLFAKFPPTVIPLLLPTSKVVLPAMVRSLVTVISACNVKSVLSVAVERL